MTDREPNLEPMEAIYKLKASELDISLVKAIKSLFKGPPPR
jgi:hypothetical protein